MTLYFPHHGQLRKKNSTACPASSESALPRATKRTASVAGMSDLAASSDGSKQDNYEMLFGRVDPKHIPESGGWWKTRQTELMAISDDHELGLMTGMVAITQNDLSPELIAHARRGPCAVPTPDEKIAYLLTRRAP